MRETAPILRHWKILRSLSARGTGATLREMAEDTGVSQKTISRDLLMLKQVGFSLVETVGDQNRKNWRLEQAQGIPPITFTIEEAAALYLGRQFLQPLAGTLFYSGLIRRLKRFGLCWGMLRCAICKSWLLPFITKVWVWPTIRAKKI